MLMQTVSTLMVLINTLVTKDTLGMDSHVKVQQIILIKFWHKGTILVTQNLNRFSSILRFFS